MAQREIRAFDYVNQPYDRVRDALRGDAGSIFHSATEIAEARTGELVASLTVEVKGIALSKEITIRIGDVREEPGPKLSHVTHIELEWQAKTSASLFPTMKADLSVYPLSATETQIDLKGQYEPPLGALGGAIDAIAGHRIAEASIHRFVTAVAERLRHLPARP
jgi:hypothetical protein